MRTIGGYHALRCPYPPNSMRTRTRRSSVFSQQRFDVFRLCDHHHAPRRNDEPAFFVLLRIETNPDALGNRHAFVDDSPADFRIPADVYPREYHGILDLGEAVDAGLRTNDRPRHLP